jgi:RHH-type proline utilization regulon transcriptional repressor/proline dehydrogenase/delta 1-pyrroline-5-carboxylate dehydrogenase
MGEALYETLLEDEPHAACRVYAPVGAHRDLLAYLVRRLLENGANTSFVAEAADPDVPVSSLLRRPQSFIDGPQHARNPAIPLPGDLYGRERRNSEGIALGEQAAVDALLAAVAAVDVPMHAAPLINGSIIGGRARDVLSPSDGSVVGAVVEGDDALASSAVAAACDGFPNWTARPMAARTAVLERGAEVLHDARPALIALLQREGGKTLDDAIAEVREAIDYCRYYAAQARSGFAPRAMPGPTGESNTLTMRGRGVFVCVSPWNFPLAIFLGQITAALVAGNTVVAKPAEQTPLIAALAVSLLHKAGVPQSALHLLPGDGTIGAALVADARIAGVAFTGSTTVARAIHRALAAKDGPIVPLIAETGGINPMIVDATALLEQVTDDVVTSAFRSAGQRCSALRLLCVQEDIADRLIDMIAGAAAELRLGDPRDPATHVGPVIEAAARDRLTAWIDRHQGHGAVLFRWDALRALPPQGYFVPPAIVALDGARDLREEVFGPVLHVVRWQADERARLLDDIAAGGTALTLGIHSRIDATVSEIAARLPHGNVYVNRNMIGAVVGTQPFGGSGLSGTGPKAGGPHYLAHFAAEQVVTINTAAAGGNAILLSGEN